MLLRIGQFPVDFVGHYKYIMSDNHLGNGLQILPLHNCAGGIVGKGQNQKLGSVRDRRLQLLRGQTEFIFRLQINDNGRSPRHNGTGLVGDIAGLGNQHFLPRIQHGPHSDVDSLGTSHGDQHLLYGVIVHSVLPVHIMADLLAQLFQPCIGGVKGSSLFQRIDSLVPDMPGRIKIRLAHAQGNCVLHLADNVKKFPYSGWFNSHNFIC